MLSQRVRAGFANTRQPYQGAGMRAHCKKIRPELVMQFARNFLAFQILKRDCAFGEPPLLLHGIRQRSRKVVQLGTDFGEFGRPAGFYASIVGSSFNTGHRL